MCEPLRRNVLLAMKTVLAVPLPVGDERFYMLAVGALGLGAQLRMRMRSIVPINQTRSLAKLLLLRPWHWDHRLGYAHVT